MKPMQVQPGAAPTPEEHLVPHGLPLRWQSRQRFVLLQSGFGLGERFVDTWEAWRADPQRCDRLWFVAAVANAPTRQELTDALAASPQPQRLQALIDAWPALAPGMHRLAFEDGRVVLQIVLGDFGKALSELVLQADAFCLDDPAASDGATRWDRHVFKGLARLASPEATLTVVSADAALRQGLLSAGFTPDESPSAAPTPHGDAMTRARYLPSFEPKRARGRRQAASTGKVLIIGAGLSGAACAWALAREGHDCTVIDRQPPPTPQTWGKPIGGLFHGIVNAQDGAHARFNRAAALEAQRLYAPLVAQGLVGGQMDGLLRLESKRGDVAAMQALLAALNLPADYVQALDAEAAAALSGLAPRLPAWFYPGGGWLEPGSLLGQFYASPRIAVRWDAPVQTLSASASGWRALDAAGQVLAEAETVVLANAHDALRLLDATAWPLTRERGQVTRVPGATAGLRRPRIPLADGGYALTLSDGDVLCGATSLADDEDAALRVADHAENLDRLERMTGSRPLLDDLQGLEGRVGWRCKANDRLPLIGAVPAKTASATERRRDVPRVAGLFMCVGLASRGLTWAPLAGQVLASWVTGAPFPLEAGLLDALDPARFAQREPAGDA